MKVLHVVWALKTGGVETMLVDIVNRQVEKDNVAVGVLVINDLVEENVVKKISPKVETFYCQRPRSSKSPLDILKMNYYVWKFKPDVLHFHGRNIAERILWFGPKVITIHNTGYKKTGYKYYKKLFAISDVVKNEWFPIVGNRVTTVMNGIVCDNIVEKKTYEQKKNDFHFVSVGRLLSFQKGQDLLFLAISKVKRELPGCHFTLHLVGDGRDEQKLKKMTHLLGIEDEVVFEGLKDRTWVYENLCKYDLFIQPSRFEGFGLTVAEACVAKIPVLVCDSEGPLEIINNGELGLTFKCAERCEDIYENVKSDDELASVVNQVSLRDAHSVDELAKKIVFFLKEGYPQDILEKAYVNVRSKYDVRYTAERYLDEYSLLNK